MNEHTEIALIAAGGPVISAVIAATLTPIITNYLKTRRRGKPTIDPAAESSPKSNYFTYFFRILLLGFSITAIIAALAIERKTAELYKFVNPDSIPVPLGTIESLKQQLEAQQKALGPIPGKTEQVAITIEDLKKALGTIPGADKPAVIHRGDSVDITCPPGFYVNGISFAMQSGGSHGQVYSITPLYKPFLPPDKNPQPPDKK